MQIRPKEKFPFAVYLMSLIPIGKIGDNTDISKAIIGKKWCKKGLKKNALSWQKLMSFYSYLMDHCDKFSRDMYLSYSWEYVMLKIELHHEVRLDNFGWFYLREWGVWTLLLERVKEIETEGSSTVIWRMRLTPFIGQWMISLSGGVNLITRMAEISRKELNAITQSLVSARTGHYDWYCTYIPSIPLQEPNR